MPQVGPTIGQFLRECFREEAKGLTVDEAVANVLPRYCGTKPVDEPEEKTDMAGGVNKVIIIGNLGRDPEVRYTQSGQAVSNLRVAVTERAPSGDSYVDKTEWVDVVCFGKTAENCGQHLKKGRQIYAEGRLQTRKWTDKEGGERYSTEVVAQRVTFLGGGGNPGTHEDRPRRQRQQHMPAMTAAEAKQADDFYDDDLPF